MMLVYFRRKDRGGKARFT